MRRIAGTSFGTGCMPRVGEENGRKMRKAGIPFLPSSELPLVIRVLDRTGNTDHRLSRQEQTFAHRAPALKTQAPRAVFLSSKSKQFPTETNS